MTDRESLIELLRETASLTPPICQYDRPFEFDVMDKKITAYCKPFEQFQDLLREAADALANGVVVREKGEWGLEARSFYRDTFDESCELVVYILANCTNCGEKHPNAHQVFSKTLYAPEDAEEDFRFNQSLERMNALREFKAKGYKFAHFCPNCGADMRKGENDG